MPIRRRSWGHGRDGPRWSSGATAVGRYPVRTMKSPRGASPDAEGACSSASPRGHVRAGGFVIAGLAVAWLVSGAGADRAFSVTLGIVGDQRARVLNRHLPP